MAFLQRVANLVTVEPSLFMFCIGYFMYFTTFEDTIFTRICFDKYKNLTFCKEEKIAKDDDFLQEMSSRWMLYAAIAYLVPACLVSLYTGSWGDKLGRKIPLLIPCILFFITAITCIVWSVYIETAPYWSILLIKFLSGIGGGEISMAAGSVSYVAEKSTAENRILRLSIVEGQLILGASLGPLLSGIITNRYGYTLVFILVAVMSALSFFYTWFFVTNIQRNEEVTFKSLFSLKHSWKALYTCFRARKNNNRRYILLCMLVFGTLFYALGMEHSLLYLYLKDAPLYWNFEQYTFFIAMRSVTEGMSLFIILPILKRYTEVKDSIIGIVGVLSSICYHTIMGLSEASHTVYLTLFVTGFRIFGNVATRSIISKLVDTEEEGRVFTVVSMIQYIMLFASTNVSQILWPILRSDYRGLLFELNNIFLFISLFALKALHFRENRNSNYVEIIY